MVQNIPGKTFPTVWKQNFSLKTQMVQNIPGKSFPQQFENRIFCWKLIWYKTFQGKVSPNSLKTEFFVENSNGTKFPQKIEKSSSVLLPFQFWPIKWPENA